MSLYGTYSESKIVMARKGHDCAHCRSAIEKGEVYLRYAFGQRNRKPICIDCAMRENEHGDLVYDCYEMRDFLGIEQRRN